MVSKGTQNAAIELGVSTTVLEWELDWYQIKLASYQLVCHKYPITCGQSESTEFRIVQITVQPNDVTCSITSHLNRYFEHIGIRNILCVSTLWYLLYSSGVGSRVGLFFFLRSCGLTAHHWFKTRGFSREYSIPRFLFRALRGFFTNHREMSLISIVPTLLNLLAMMLVFFCLPMWQ